MSTRQPHRFTVQLTRPASGARLDAAPRATIVGGAPPEFGGTDTVWSPEHLFVSSVALCFLTTFEFFARRGNLTVVEFSTNAEGTVEKTPRGLAFTGVRLDVRVGVPAGEAARAQELLATAKRSCLISNSLACPVELAAEVHEVEAPVVHAAS
jgi:organic hydroperoxide reductase OsmC/OhrA